GGGPEFVPLRSHRGSGEIRTALLEWSDRRLTPRTGLALVPRRQRSPLHVAGQSPLLGFILLRARLGEQGRGVPGRLGFEGMAVRDGFVVRSGPAPSARRCPREPAPGCGGGGMGAARERRNCALDAWAPRRLARGKCGPGCSVASAGGAVSRRVSQRRRSVR